MENHQVYPLLFMTNLEPVITSKKIDDNPFSEKKLKGEFSVAFSVIKENDVYSFSFVFERMNKEDGVPILLSRYFDDINSKEARDFVQRVFSWFKPYKRAILSFDKRGYPLADFQKIIRKWNSELKDFDTGV